MEKIDIMDFLFAVLLIAVLVVRGVGGGHAC